MKRMIGATTLGLETGPTVARYTMYERIKFAIKDRDRSDFPIRILSVSHSSYLASLVEENGEVVKANFP